MRFEFELEQRLVCDLDQYYLFIHRLIENGFTPQVDKYKLVISVPSKGRARFLRRSRNFLESKGFKLNEEQ
jgi:hypothetical protein